MTGMRVTEQELRTVALAQAVEHADTGRTLVSQTEIDEATRSAIAAARERGVQRVEVGDVVLDRAAAIVARASGRNPAVAALERPSVRLQWLARTLPALALLLGLAIDRIANAHRVDLLSPPLLLVIGWNLAVYALLAWRATRPRGLPSPQVPSAVQALRQWVRLPGARAGRAGVSARIAADFHGQWFAGTAELFLQRQSRVLHLCAAAWAAGIALSLLLRGLVVRYQFGWESTFLDAGQVHAIVSVLFWPLTAWFGLAPFTLQDIAATQNFAGEGVAGSRWVGMYVGLLALAVVLPRLALAAWAAWRAARLSRQCRIDPEDSAFDSLREGMPGDFVLGLQGADPAQAQALRGIVAWHARQGAVHSAQGDRLRFAEATGTAVGQPVDAVLAWDSAPQADPVPPAWQAAPVLALRWSEFAESWVLEPALFDRLGAVLPRHRQALERLRQAWVERNAERFEASLQALAQHLRTGASLGGGDAAARYARQVQTLDAALWALHGHAAAPPGAASAPLSAHAGPLVAPARRADGTAVALGTSAGAAAGAAAGAKVGALIDVGSGGMTLGAGTALGALLGGTTAWVVRSFQKKDAAQEGLLRVAEAALTRYLVIAHQARVPEQEATRLAERWRAEVTATVAVHGAALDAALKAEPAPADPLLPLLRTMLQGVLRRSFMPAAQT